MTQNEFNDVLSHLKNRISVLQFLVSYLNTALTTGTPTSQQTTAWTNQKNTYTNEINVLVSSLQYLRDNITPVG